jgi:hypothetical protein
VPGLGRLVIDEDQVQDQKVVFWGIQSRYYDAASTAALFFQAESLIDGTLLTGPAGASGGASNNTRGTTSLTTSLGLMATMAGTQVGTFRVLGRVRFSGTGVFSTQARSKVRNGPTVSGDTVTLPNLYKDTWHLVDYGLVYASPAPLGTHQLAVAIWAASTVAGDDFYLDWLALIPVDEGSGVARGVTSGSSTIPLPAAGHLQIDHKSVLRSIDGIYWAQPDIYEGDYLLIPPAGAEGRTVRMIVKATEASVTTSANSVYANDTGIDDISAHLYYTPRYLSVPAP